MSSVSINRKRDRRSKGTVKEAFFGFVRSITSPTELPPDVQKIVNKVDRCVEHCTHKIEQLAHTRQVKDGS